MIVVDANVITYMLIPGEATSLAEKVYAQDNQWIAPDLWRSEVRNVLALYVRHKKISVDKAIIIMDRAQRLIRRPARSIETAVILRLAQESGCTAYDCEYVALAQMLSIPLVTSDKELLFCFPSKSISMEKFLISAAF